MQMHIHFTLGSLDNAIHFFSYYVHSTYFSCMYVRMCMQSHLARPLFHFICGGGKKGLVWFTHASFLNDPTVVRVIIR